MDDDKLRNDIEDFVWIVDYDDWGDDGVLINPDSRNEAIDKIVGYIKANYILKGGE